MDNNNNFITGVLNGNPLPPQRGLFISKPASEWLEDAAKMPPMRMLCGELWHEYELCFLFADTNLGKSIFAVQIADAISRGQGQECFKVATQAQKVLYFDFELSARQFEMRYSSPFGLPYNFNPNFIRIEMNPDCSEVIDFETALFANIEAAINDSGAKVLIVDNITYLKTQSTDTAKEALPLMNMLIRLKRRYNLSIMALAHTPKRANGAPVTLNDLAGSRHLANFADSIFAIGHSNKGGDIRYIKQLKARSAEKAYNEDNVIVCQIEKPGDFLHFNHVSYDYEREHLAELGEEKQKELDKNIISLHTEDPKLSDREIARQLNTNHKRVGRVLRRNGLR